MFDVTLSAAFVAGLLSFLSPCVLPLVPPYLIYLTGASLDEQSQSERRALPPPVLALLFVLGFSTVFVGLGASASLIGAVLRAYSHVFSVVAGVAIILMGLHFLGVWRIGMLLKQARVDVRPSAGPVGAYVMGLAFAFGWTPCIGPVLAGILALAASEHTVARGAGMLAVYSAGLGLPFLIASVMLKGFLKLSAGLKKHLHRVEQAMGALLVLTGIGFLTGMMSTAAFWLLETFPALAWLG